MVKANKEQRIIPTYIPRKANDLPMFFENKPYQGASGRLYPLPFSDGISDDKTDVSYEVFTLENEYVKTDVVPALGGKILRGYDKCHDYDFIYYNEVVKPALVGLAGPWISGGIEFNWPQHHRPTTYMPLEAVIEENADGGKTVWTGEVEPFGRMKGMAGITVDAGRSYIKAKVRVYNRTDVPQLFMWWANLAVPVNDDYRTVFPPDCEWVNDHDRRAVLSWPIAKGLYKTARPYDFGEGTDLSRYSAVKVPSSYLISQGQSDMDFVAGYDCGIQKGIATVANHHISPGKKMWHWGIGDFGDMWCNNLTDKNGPYIELMTGVFTDNQPDFTWIAPYETKEFEQFWYPLYGIGDVKNATVDAAMNLEQRDDKVYAGFNVTGCFKNVTMTLTAGGKTLYSKVLSMEPGKAYEAELPLGGLSINDITASLTDENGKVLVSYKPYIRGQKQPIAVRQPVKRPRDYKTVEELYINGFHLEQYKQHNYKPQDYYLEGLARDPGDIRCNTSMGRLSLKNGRFADCVTYCDKAIERLCDRNQHPVDTEAFYLKGLALVYLGRYEEAYDILYRAAWNYTHRSAAYFQLALLDCRKGEYTLALQKLEESLGLNKGHTKAQNLRTAILRKLGCPGAQKSAEEGYNDDKLDLFAKIEYSHFADVKAELTQYTVKPENFIDVACDYMSAGLYEDALYALSLAGEDYPLLHYYRGYCQHKLGRDGSAAIAKAESMDTGYCFPARLDDIAVLQFAIDSRGGANACYYLGSLLYDRFNYDEAAKLWQSAVEADPTHGKAWRNLSLYWFDKKDNAPKARHCLERALVHKSDDPRLLLEYQQLLKNSGASIDERLTVYEKYPQLLALRDDCYLDRLTLVSQQGNYADAIELARVKRFHIYEGGEGKLTKQHAWMHVLYGLELAAAGDAAAAEKAYMDGVNMPKSYGEAKTFFNQEAHIFYCLGLLKEQQGQDAGAAFEKAAEYKAAVSEISAFRALALRKLGLDAQAQAVIDEMHAAADNFIVNKDLRTYYGVGSPSPMPFELNIEKNNLKAGWSLKAFALLAEGKYAEADEAMAKAAAIDENEFVVYTYRQIRNLL